MWCVGAVELRNTVSSFFGLELPATATFDHPTIDALARYIASHAAPADAGAQPSQATAQLVPSAAAIAHRLTVCTPFPLHHTMYKLLACKVYQLRAVEILGVALGQAAWQKPCRGAACQVHRLTATEQYAGPCGGADRHARGKGPAADGSRPRLYRVYGATQPGAPTEHSLLLMTELPLPSMPHEVLCSHTAHMQSLRQACVSSERGLTPCHAGEHPFAVALPATASFDYPTVAALAAYIASKSAPAAVSVPAPAALGHVTESERVSSTAPGTSDLIGMSSMLATSPVPGEGKCPQNSCTVAARSSPHAALPLHGAL